MGFGFSNSIMKEGSLMIEVGLLTLKNVSVLLIFIALGYILQHSHKFPEDAAKVISTLTTLLFLPAYSLNNLAQNFTMETIGQKVTILGFGVLFTFAAIALGLLLAKIFGKDTFDRHSLTYAFTFPNYGYFGFPLIEGVFGAEMLADFLIFTIPFNIACHTFGYILFAPEKKINWKKVLLTPAIVAVIVGCAIGISGIKLPPLITSILTTAGSCMSPMSMILAGFLLGCFKVKHLLSSFRAYWISAIRMVGIPALFGILLFACGVRGNLFLLPLLTACLPLGLNLVVFPESYGLEDSATSNARICFVSILLALILLPINYAVLVYLAGI